MTNTTKTVLWIVVIGIIAYAIYKNWATIVNTVTPSTSRVAIINRPIPVSYRTGSLCTTGPGYPGTVDSKGMCQPNRFGPTLI